MGFNSHKMWIEVSDCWIEERRVREASCSNKLSISPYYLPSSPYQTFIISLSSFPYLFEENRVIDLDCPQPSISVLVFFSVVKRAEGIAKELDASLAFSFSCVNREAVNSLLLTRPSKSEVVLSLAAVTVLTQELNRSCDVSLCTVLSDISFDQPFYNFLSLVHGKKDSSFVSPYHTWC